ncbi:MAG: class I SAM-dependent methyltransferase [Gaiellaceae bacterium]
MALFESDTAYDSFMGRYSRRLAPHFADFAGVEHGMAVADVGAGTGALTSELVQRGAQVAAADPSDAFVAALYERLPEIDVHAAPAEALPWPDETFDAALAQLVVAFMRDAPAGVGEMRRVARVGGTVAVCMWDREGMEMLAAIHRAQRVLASTGPMAEARTLYRTREEIESLFADGFVDVETELLEVEAGYTGFEEFWEALSGGAGPAGAWVVSLGDEERAAAHDEIYRQLGEPPGQFRLRAAAWATRARRE